jgi:hypothetical protein
MTVNKLKVCMTTIPHPYPEEEISKDERWGRLSLVILDSALNESTLLDMDWDLLPFIEWFNENKDILFTSFLICEELDMYPLPDESLAQALLRLQDRDFSEDDESVLADQWYEALFDFREHHSLRFALRGTKIPEIILGNNAGKSEISVSKGDYEWSYEFDENDFFQNIHESIEQFLRNC